MSAPILDHLRSITHDAGVAAGAAVTDVSGAAIDALHSVDADRIADFPGAFVGGAAGASSKLTRRLSARRIVIGVGVIVAAGVVTAVIVRSRRHEDPTNPDQISTRSRNPESRASDGPGQSPDTGDVQRATQNPELAAAGRG
ncbi:MAG: hypothetical protein WBL31_09225 [Ilumatobacteraceae bacterium]